MESWWLSSHWSGNRVVNDLQHTTLALTWSDRQLDRPNPINQLVLLCSSTHVYFPPNILSNLLLWNNAQSFLQEGKGLRVNSVKRKGFFDSSRLSNLAEAQNLALNMCILVLYPCLSQGEWFPLWFIPFSSWTPWWVVEHWTIERHVTDMASFSNKKFKRNLNELDSSDNETEAPRKT